MGLSDARIDFLKTLNEDECLALEYKDFTISEINEIIAETPMTDQEKRMAVLRYNKCMTFQEIADAEQVDIKTAKKKIAVISSKMKTTLNYLRLFK